MRPGIRLRPSTFVFLAVLFLTGAVSLPAYVPLRWSGNGARGAWTAARFPLTFYLNDVTARGLPNVTAGSDPAAAVRAALSS